MSPPGTVVICPYCQAETRIDDGKLPQLPQLPQFPVPTTSLPPPSARKPYVGLIVILVILPIVGGIIWAANRPTSSSPTCGC